VRSNQSECVRPLKKQLADGFEDGWESIDEIEFVQGRNDEIALKHDNARDTSGNKTTVYRRSDSGDWSAIGSHQGPVSDDEFTVSVHQSFKEPPVLVGSDAVTKRSRTILDPNPQLKAITLGDPETYSWRDQTGRAWQGILYKPVGFMHGTKYPLVIQNHGFTVPRYLPSGGFPTAFVAQELASAGIMVLQVRDCAGRSTPLEGPCNVAGYEGAVDQLSQDGMVDPTRVGIIGFSRTVFYVLEALTTSRLRFKAASITDGITLGYLDYLECVGLPDGFNDDKVGIIGTEPFGDGLAQWLKASPDFHLDKVSTPLRVVATRELGVVGMWEPYAILEAMHKPVDLIVLNTREHVLEDPVLRLVAQTGNVDWFRFWLEDYEDPDPAKQPQYARWRQLRGEMRAK
jgi:dipeptidyl aminopeptidase/acylaminoacyl peptidase